jgi:hypothetical protein
MFSGGVIERLGFDGRLGMMWIDSGFPTVFPKLSLHNTYYT